MQADGSERGEEGTRRARVGTHRGGDERTIEHGLPGLPLRPAQVSQREGEAAGWDWMRKT